jgi:hypothetical protein
MKTIFSSATKLVLVILVTVLSLLTVGAVFKLSPDSTISVQILTIFGSAVTAVIQHYFNYKKKDDTFPPSSI